MAHTVVLEDAPLLATLNALQWDIQVLTEQFKKTKDPGLLTLINAREEARDEIIKQTGMKPDV